MNFGLNVSTSVSGQNRKIHATCNTPSPRLPHTAPTIQRETGHSAPSTPLDGKSASPWRTHSQFGKPFEIDTWRGKKHHGALPLMPQKESKAVHEDVWNGRRGNNETTLPMHGYAGERRFRVPIYRSALTREEIQHSHRMTLLPENFHAMIMMHQRYNMAKIIHGVP